MNPGIDIIVVNYQSPEDLYGFLTSYQELDIEIPHTLHVVSVCPTEEDRRIVQQAACGAPFLYTEHNENVGYARACNEAASVPDREVLAFFNADTVLWPGVLESCYNELMGDDSLGVVGPKQVNEYNRITSAGILGTSSQPLLRGWQEADVGQYDDERYCVSVAGSAYFVKREVWDYLTECPYFTPYGANGAFLPTQHYYEETYLSYHARHHGWGVKYLGTTKMTHKWHGASPVGSVEGAYLRSSQELFRSACNHHGMDHD